MSSKYFELTKPRLAIGNLVIAAAAFVFGSTELTASGSLAPIDWRTFILMFIGLWAVIGSACVFNNIYDRDIDARMERTQNRAMVTGAIPHSRAALFGVLLLVTGILLLLQINIYALGVALAGWLSYVFLYTPLKHISSAALYVGAIAGATPPVVGYAAAAGVLDWYAAGLFVLLYLWQLPHFLAIARYRWDEYAAAGVPLAVSKPADERQRRRAQMVFYASLALLIAVSMLLILQRWMR